MSKNLKVESGNGGGSSPPLYYKESALGTIDVNSEESLQKWEAVLHMERRELLEAVREFGPVVKDIRKGLLARRNEAA